MNRTKEQVPSAEALGKLGNRRVRFDMTPNEAFEFLSKLASDDAFRQRLKKNPKKELAKYHIYLPRGPVASPVTLPPKSTLKKAYDKITLSREFKTESAALTAAALSYVWFHPIFTGWRFRLVPARRKL